MMVQGLPERWKAEEVAEEHELGAGYLIEDRWFKTLQHITFDTFHSLSQKQLAAITARGRDVDHITRVTGYFSKTSGWNKGKTRELKDRHRSGL